MNLLRITDELITNGAIIHLPDHNFELSDTSLINFAKIIDEFDDIVSFKSSHGGSIFSLNDSTIVDVIIPEESTISEVQSV